VLLAEIDSSFSADRSDDDLSIAFGIEILAGRDTVPESFANTSTSGINIAVEIIDDRRYLRINQNANLRANSVVSKIWNHGFEYRSPYDYVPYRQVSVIAEISIAEIICECNLPVKVTCPESSRECPCPAECSCV
jgi:hypothetical protein